MSCSLSWCFLNLIILTDITSGYKVYQTYIPNGDRVPNPCILGELWPAVGHSNPQGGGHRNPFGRKFNMYLPWSEICPHDWDEDGLTNGQELGDPDCTWSQGNVHINNTHISHPGVCEPIDSEFCREKNSAARIRICPGFRTETVEVCDGSVDAETETFDLRLNISAVPEQMTTYVCQVFDLPFAENRTYDLFSGKPIIGNREVLHHMVLFGCDNNDVLADPSRGLFTCFMNDQTGCRSMIAAFAAWDDDVNAFCLPDHVGVKLGPGGFSRLMIQYHWTNIEMKPGLTDNSGIRLFYTPRMRNHTSGMLMVGQTYLEIPPRKERSTFSGGCVEECSKHRIKAPVKVIDLFHHMHYLGKEQYVEIYRNGSRVRLLSSETDFSYNVPKFFRFKDSIELLPGDYIKTTCVFDSRRTNRTTFFGEGTLDEMCFTFIRFYPLENLPLLEGGCSEYKSIPLCKVFTPKRYIISGCDVRNFLLTEKKRLFADVLQNCRVFGKCLPECKETLRELHKHPCLNNDIGDLVKSHFMMMAKEDIQVLAAMNLCSVNGKWDVMSSISYSSNTEPLHRIVSTFLVLSVFSIFKLMY